MRINTRVIFCVFLLAAIMAFGQVDTGTISGTVRDSSGAVIPATKVVVQNEDTGISRTVEADAAGHYSASSMGLGNYRITGTHDGFQTQVRSGVTLNVGREAIVDLQLTVGAVNQTVEVSGEAAAIETTNATVSGLVTSDQIRDLPLNGRSIDSLALLSPGTLQTSSRNNALTMGMGLRLSVNGGRQDANVFLIDGTVANDHAANGPNSAAGQALGVEGIQEFRVLTHSYSAEYGRNSGAVVSQVTRAGTNSYHGSAYEFVRNNFFDSRNYFNTGDLPAFRRNQYGAAIGGPIVKDKAFFFANYEGLRQRQGNSVIATVPDDNARAGLVPCATAQAAAPAGTTVACNTATNLSPVTVSSAMIPYINLYPRANGTNFKDGTAEYRSTFMQPADEDYVMGRVDTRISDKDSFFGRYIFDNSKGSFPRPVPTFVSEQKGRNNFFVLSETHIFSGTSVNQFRSSINRTFPSGGDHPIDPIDPALSFVRGQPFGKIEYAVNQQIGTGGAGLTALGLMFAPSGDYEQKFAQNIFEQNDTFSTIRGAHSIKFGADFQRIQLNQGSFNGTGTYRFGGLIGLLAGTPTQFAVSLPPGVTRRGFRRNDFGWFIQDDYRIRPNLTLNIGLRHEFFTPPNEVGGRVGQLINLTDATETPGVTYVPRKSNFSPRVGIAWDPNGRGKTSIRAGAGVFYNFIDGRTWYVAVQGASIFAKNATINNPIFPHALDAGIPAGSATITSMTYRPDEPTVMHYNLDIQHQLTSTLSFQVGYVGSLGYHMAHLTQPNVRIPQVQPNGSLLFPATGPLVNPNFAGGGIQTVLFDGRYNYNAFQTVLQKRLSAGLQFQLSYTFAKTMSDGDQITNTGITSSAASQLNIFNRRQDYSLSSFDQRHTVVLNGSYKMPWDKRFDKGVGKILLGGWSMNGIYSYGSGLPMNIQTGFNRVRNTDTLLTDRPDVTPGFSNNPISGVTAGCTGIPAGQPLGTADRWYDPCAFSLQPVGTFGNAGRNTITLPPLNNVNFAVVKITQISEQKAIEFRAESFNMFNHTQLGLPGRSVFDSTGARVGNAGSVTNTAVDARQMQFGLKFIF